MSTATTAPQWLESFQNYTPTTDREIADYKLIQQCLESFDHNKLFTRENVVSHFTASGFILNAQRDKTLMIYHNIYDSFAWTGGHNDGDVDFFDVAYREAMEETGLTTDTLKPITSDIISIEVLAVPTHVKRGELIATHLHLNFTFAFEADEDATVVVKPDENSAVEWIAVADMPTRVKEVTMVEIYTKIIKNVLKHDAKEKC